MKKIFVLIGLIVLSLSLFGCSRSGNPAAPTVPAGQQPSAPNQAIGNQNQTQNPPAGIEQNQTNQSPPPPSNGSQNTVSSPPSPPVNGSLDKGMDLFDFTVDPLISDTSAEVPK